MILVTLQTLSNSSSLKHERAKIIYYESVGHEDLNEISREFSQDKEKEDHSE
jgi:hypothetical protein